MGLTSDAASCCGTALGVRASIVSLSRRRLGPDTNEGQTAQDSPAEPRVLPAPLWASRPTSSARYARSAPAPSALLPGPCLTLPQPPCPCFPSPRAPVDGNFCHVALQYKIHIKEQLPKALSAVCKEQVTRCVMEELRRLGPDFSGALFIAKRFEMRRCSHKEPVSAAECLASLVGTLPWRIGARPLRALIPTPRSAARSPPPRARPRAHPTARSAAAPYCSQGTTTPTTTWWRPRTWACARACARPARSRSSTCSTTCSCSSRRRGPPSCAPNRSVSRPSRPFSSSPGADC